MRLAVVSISVLLTSCFDGPGFFSQSGAARTELSVKTTTSGGVTSGTYDPNLTQSQAIAAAGGEVSGSSILLPAGALAIKTNISIESGETLNDQGLLLDLGLDSSTQLTSASSAVVVESSAPVNASKPFTLQIPVSATSLALAKRIMVVVYRAYDASVGKNLIGVIPNSAVSFVGGAAQFKTIYFGSYQVVYSNVTISEPVKKETTQPIVKKRDLAKLNPNWVSEMAAQFDEAQRKLTVSYGLSDTNELMNTCYLTLDSDKAAPWDYRAKVTGRDPFLVDITREDAHDLYAKVDCRSKLNRMVGAKDWSGAFSISAKAVVSVPKVYEIVLGAPYTNVSANSCTLISVTYQEQGGSAATASEALTVVFSTTSTSGGFFSEGTCSTATTASTVQAGSGTAQVYYLDNTEAGATVLTGTSALGNSQVSINVGDFDPPQYGTASHISITSATSTSVSFYWTKGIDNVTPQSAITYRVYRSSNPNISTVADVMANGTLIYGPQPDIDSYTVSGLSEGEEFFLNVVMTDSAGNQRAMQYVYASAPKLSAFEAAEVMDIHIDNVNNYQFVAAGLGGAYILRMGDPQPIKGHISSGNYGINCIERNGDYVYVCRESDGFAIFRVNGGGGTIEAPLFISQMSGVTAKDLRVQGGYVYLAAGSSVLKVIDVSTPTTPSLAGSYSYSLGGTPYGDHIEITGTTAYVSGMMGIVSIDITTPSAPSDHVRFAGSYTGRFAIEGTKLYMPSNSDVLEFDISTPNVLGSPTTHTPSGLFSRAVAVNSGRLAAANGNYMDTPIFTLPMSNTPTKVVSGTLGYATQVEMDGTYLYVGTEDGTIQRINHSTLANAAVDATLTLGAGSHQDKNIRIDGQYAYASNGYAGMMIYDISFPKNLIRKGHFLPSIPQLIKGVDGSGNLAVACGASDFFTIDVTDKAVPSQLASVYLGTMANECILEGNILYVGGGSDVKIYDLTNPASPALAGTIAAGSSVKGIDLSGDLLFVAAYTGGLKIWDISNPGSPVAKGVLTFSASRNAMGARVTGDLVAVAHDNLGFSIVNVADPDTLALEFSSPTSGETTWEAIIVGATLYAGQNSTLKAYDIGTPSSPSLRAAEYSLPAAVKAVGFYQDHAILNFYKGVGTFRGFYFP